MSDGVQRGAKGVKEELAIEDSRNVVCVGGTSDVGVHNLIVIVVFGFELSLEELSACIIRVLSIIIRETHSQWHLNNRNRAITNHHRNGGAPHPHSVQKRDKSTQKKARVRGEGRRGGGEEGGGKGWRRVCALP